ncbi:MAG: hypothetical protein EAZ57_11400 [Cytophagales bacterium]|nr:MAG: hypothetical protein EAZ67_12335 [Cytophagales bacterium]TAF59366.1 MAG: hypothetical protein EAZ57_11400 [Cytophagales bacterium]
MKKLCLVLVFFFAVWSANAQKSSTLESLYQQGIANAAYPEPSEISSELLAISKENPSLIWKTIQNKEYVLVASWQADTVFYKNNPQTGFYNTTKYPIWVTAAPQLQQWVNKTRFEEDTKLRLEQLLGLPPNGNKKFFIEFWVQPKDLFRPCPDSEITDNACALIFPKDAKPEHIQWINDLRLNSYFMTGNKKDVSQNYPWTQLGYSYDWNPKNISHVGMSEFVINTNADIVVHKFYTTEQYCKK